MTGPVEIFVVEPSTAVRDALSSLFDGTDGARVAGVSADADAALRMVGKLSPTVVLLGAELPGAAALTRCIMSEHPTPVVALIDPGQAELGSALLAEGAVSMQLRPRDDTATRRFRSVVLALAQVSVVRRRAIGSGAMPPSVPAVRPPLEARDTTRMVAVAASTGGPVALQQLFAHLGEDLPVPVVVVQHMTVGFTAGLVATLQLSSALPIRVATDTELLRPGTVYLAPDGHHLTVSRFGRARLRDDPPVGGFRPSASVLFSSLANAYGATGVAVVLTGMGTDGLTGLHEVHAAGGCVLAQDEDSSVVFGMPGAAVTAGIADLVAPVEEIAAQIAALTRTEEER